MPSFGDLFRIRRVVGTRPLAPGELRLESADVPVVRTEGVFVTEQSLLSFPGTAAGVTILWRLVGVVWPSLANDHLAALACAILVGLAVFGVSVVETWNHNTVAQNMRSVIIGLINTAMLFLTATGVDATIAGAATPGAAGAP